MSVDCAEMGCGSAKGQQLPCNRFVCADLFIVEVRKTGSRYMMWRHCLVGVFPRNEQLTDHSLWFII